MDRSKVEGLLRAAVNRSVSDEEVATVATNDEEARALEAGILLIRMDSQDYLAREAEARRQARELEVHFDDVSEAEKLVRRMPRR